MLTKGVRLACRGERKARAARYCEQVEIDASKYDATPVQFSLACGTAFVVVKTTPRVQMQTLDDAVNQHATYFNIDMCSGIAPPHWQVGVGPVLIFRTDGTDMTEPDLDVAVDRVSDTLDMFGESIPGFDAFEYIRNRVAHDMQQ